MDHFHQISMNRLKNYLLLNGKKNENFKNFIFHIFFKNKKIFFKIPQHKKKIIN